MSNGSSQIDPIFLRVQEVQKHLNLSNMGMANALGISREAYRKQQKRLRAPELYSLIRLDQYYKISIEWVLFNRGPMRLAVREKENLENLERAERLKQYEPDQKDFFSDELREMVKRMRELPQLRHAVMQTYHNFMATKSETL